MDYEEIQNIRGRLNAAPLDRLTQELDGVITRFESEDVPAYQQERERSIERFRSVYIPAYWLFIRMVCHGIQDRDLRRRIDSALLDVARARIDENIRRRMEEWQNLSDDQLHQKILDRATEFPNVGRNPGYGALDDVYPYITDAAFRHRLDAAVEWIKPQLQKINYQKLISRWRNLQDNVLKTEIRDVLEGKDVIPGVDDATFFLKVYPSIDDSGLKARVDRKLLQIASLLGQATRSEWQSRALEWCAKLHITGIRDVLIKVVREIEEPTTMELAIYYGSINRALSDFPIPEAEPFLVRQVEALPETWFDFVTNLNNAPDPIFQRYHAAGMAYEALKKINPDVARRYASKFGQESEGA